MVNEIRNSWPHSLAEHAKTYTLPWCAGFASTAPELSWGRCIQCCRIWLLAPVTFDEVCYHVSGRRHFKSLVPSCNTELSLGQQITPRRLAPLRTAVMCMFTIWGIFFEWQQSQITANCSRFAHFLASPSIFKRLHTPREGEETCRTDQMYWHVCMLQLGEQQNTLQQQQQLQQLQSGRLGGLEVWLNICLHLYILHIYVNI